MEPRLLLSNLVWTNRGQASDKFSDVFGANADGARRVVDAVLQSWATVLQNLNQPAINSPADRNTINFTISMDTAREGFGGGAAITDYAYPSEEDRAANRNGFPVAGTISLDRGTSGQPNGGWWIDPTPQDSVEYTDILSPAAARPGPLVTGTDIYSTINAEIVHVLGLFGPPTGLQTPLNNSNLTKLNTRDPQGNGSGFFYVFDGPSGTHLLTSYDSGGGGTDTGSATHTAPAEAAAYPINFTSKFRGAVSLRGGLDAGNASGGDTRILASDNVALLLKDAYNYTVRLPSTIPGFTYNVALQGRQLRLNGGPDGNNNAAQASLTAPLGSETGTGTHHGAGPNFVDDGGASNDVITLRRDGADLVVTMSLGRSGPVENVDDHDGTIPPFETRIPLADFDSIQISDGEGNDNVLFDLSGGEFLPAGGIVDDGEAGTDEVKIKLGNGAGYNFSFRSTSSTSGILTILPPPGSPPGTLPETMTLSSVNKITFEGSDAASSAFTLFVDEIVKTSEAKTPAEIPTLLPISQHGFQAVTILTSNPTTMYRAYNPNNDEHFFTTSQAEFNHVVSAGYRDESSSPAAGFTVSPTPAPNALPIFRLYNIQTGLHYLTTSAGERDYLLGLVTVSDPSVAVGGWRSEPSVGYLFSSPMPGTQEVFHLYNQRNGSHLFTQNTGELVAILSQFPDDWKLNSSLGFAYPAGFHVTASAAQSPTSASLMAEPSPAMPGELVNPDSTSSAATPLSSAVSTQTLVSLIVAEASIPAITDDRSLSDAATEPVSAMITEEATAAPEAVSLDALSALFAGELGSLLED